MMGLTPTSPYNRSRPQIRGIRVYASDPSLAESLSTADVHEATLHIRWEADPDDPSRWMARGPARSGSTWRSSTSIRSGDLCYDPCDLDDPYLLARDGLPLEATPSFTSRWSMRWR